MGRYLAPANPYEIYNVGCLRVYYPDSPLLFRALRAQLTELENRFVWETGGDIDAAEKLEQDWLEAGLLTFDAIGQGCADNGDCEQTIIDLTQQLEQCQEQLEEYENMNITVKCCCDGGGGNLPFPNPDGVQTIPLDPNDPFAENDVVWDDNALIPPPGYGATGDWVADRCRAANWFVDSYIEFVENLDLAERRISLGASVIEVAAVILAALPGPIGDWAGAAVVIKWVVQIVKALTEVVDDLEDLGDWLQTSTDAIEANKQELICAAYRMTSVEWFREFFLTFFAGYVDPALTADGWSVSVVNTMRDLFEPLADELANRAANGFANQHIPDDYVPQYDCANCIPVLNGDYVELETDLVWTSDNHGSGTSNSSHVENPNGTMKLEILNDAPNRNSNWLMYAEPVAVAAGERVIGYAVEVINPQNMSFRRMDVGSAAYRRMWAGNTRTTEPVNAKRYYIQGGPDGTDFRNLNPGLDIDAATSSMFDNACAESVQSSISCGMVSETAGTSSYTLKITYILKQASLECA